MWVEFVAGSRLAPTFFSPGLLFSSLHKKPTLQIDHFTVVCSVTWPLNGSKVGGDLVLIQTSFFVVV